MRVRDVVMQTVIASASEAIQSGKRRLDCFVASLLAMTTIMKYQEV